VNVTVTKSQRSVGPRLSALAAAEGISQPFMSELIKRLQRQGLVTRIGEPKTSGPLW
jgi:DNA-binding IscR family transcriptional regulator